MDWGRNLEDKIPFAPNFRYGEYVKSDTALRLGIVNKPGEKEWLCIESNARHIMQPMREKWGRIRITSGFRNSKLCLAIGSTAHSSHTFGWTTDSEPLEAGVSLFMVAEWAFKNLRFHTLIAEYYPEGWNHISYIDGDDSHILKLKDANHNYEVISLPRLRKLYG